MIAKLGMKALIGGALVNFTTACIAGFLVSSVTIVRPEAPAIPAAPKPGGTSLLLKVKAQPALKNLSVLTTSELLKNRKI
jgi:hypothetical protein